MSHVKHRHDTIEDYQQDQVLRVTEDVQYNCRRRKRQENKKLVVPRLIAQVTPQKRRRNRQKQRDGSEYPYIVQTVGGVNRDNVEWQKNGQKSVPHLVEEEPQSPHSQKTSRQ